jgi:hypothetical protein
VHAREAGSQFEALKEEEEEEEDLGERRCAFCNTARFAAECNGRIWVNARRTF